MICAMVVDDEPANRDFLVRLLQQADLQVEGAATGKQALEIARNSAEPLKLIMLDRKLPDMTGIEVLEELRPMVPNATIIMATMFDERAMIREAFAVGANGFLVKPHGFMELYRLVAACVKENTDFSCLDQVVFDQYGRREWRGY